MGTFEDLTARGPWLWGHGEAGPPRFCCCGELSHPSAFLSLLGHSVEVFQVRHVNFLLSDFFFFFDAGGGFYLVGEAG